MKGLSDMSLYKVMLYVGFFIDNGLLISFVFYDIAIRLNTYSIFMEEYTFGLRGYTLRWHFT